MCYAIYSSWLCHEHGLTMRSRLYWFLVNVLADHGKQAMHEGYTGRLDSGMRWTPQL
jgi:hypothetical protein